jgi:gluconate kinase
MPFDPYFERCFFCEEQLHYLQYIFTKDQLSVSLCSTCEKDYREKCKRATDEERQLYLALRKEKIPATLQHHDGVTPEQELIALQRTVHSTHENEYTIRIPNRLVKDRIAETVKSIRNLYDVEQKKRTSGDKSRPGLLF